MLYLGEKIPILKSRTTMQAGSYILAKVFFVRNFFVLYVFGSQVQIIPYIKKFRKKFFFLIFLNRAREGRGGVIS